MRYLGAELVPFSVPFSCNFIYLYLLVIQVATDSGIVQMFDARQDDKAVWTLNAHSEGVNGLVLSTQCPGCLITGSSDKTIKVWDISDGKPTHVHEQNMKLVSTNVTS